MPTATRRRRRAAAPTTTVRVPRELGVILKLCAKRNHRTVKAEVTYALEQYLISINAEQLVASPTLMELLRGTEETS